jgi:hypothetical protein
MNIMAYRILSPINLKNDGLSTWVNNFSWQYYGLTQVIQIFQFATRWLTGFFSLLSAESLHFLTRLMFFIFINILLGLLRGGAEVAQCL